MDEFSVSFTSILSFFLMPALGLILVSVSIGLLLPKSLQKRYISILFIVGLLILLQSNLLVWKYGLLDGQGIDWTESTWRGYIDGLLWVLLLAVSYFFYRPISRIAAPVAIVLICLQLFLIGFSTAQQAKYWEGKGKNAFELVPPQELFQFSSKKNVIHILMDAFQSDIFEEIVEKDPGFYYNALQGFTFFRETTGSFPTTKMSLPAIFSGRNYLNDVPMPRFLDAVYEGQTITNALYDKGYYVDLATGPDISGKHSVKYHIPVPYGVTARDYKQANSALMLDLVLFRCVPHFVKRYVYNNQAWLIQRLLLTRLGMVSNKAGEGVSALVHLSHKAYVDDMIDNMSVNRDKPVYKFMHLAHTHAPYIVNEDCSFAGHVLPNTRDNKKIQCKCSLDHFMGFLDKLKAMDIYESSLIILSADTGDGIGVNLKNMDNRIKRDEIDRIKGFANIVGSALPLMAIKPPNAKGPLKISRAQTMLSDIPATVSAILNLDVNFPGQSGFEVDPDQSRERKFYYYKWRHANWQDDFFDRMDEFIINGSVFDRTAWRKGSTFYPPAALQYTLLESIGFDANGRSTTYTTYGWSSQEKRYRWTEGSKAGMKINALEAKGKALLLRLNACGYVGKEFKYQKVGIIVNGTLITTWNLAKWDWDWYEAFIPADVSSDGSLEIVFTISNPTAPCEVSDSKDCRKLGMAVREIIIGEVEEPTAAAVGKDGAKIDRHGSK